MVSVEIVTPNQPERGVFPREKFLCIRYVVTGRAKGLEEHHQEVPSSGWL